MFKNLFKIILFLILILIFFISYLSIFGIKTDKFNELIKEQVNKQDKRLDIDFKEVFIKLNIKERSFSITNNNSYCLLGVVIINFSTSNT